MKYAGWGMGVLFLYALVVQYNDPDPLLWMAMYGLAAVMSIMAARLSWIPLAGLAAITLAGSAWLSTRVIGQQHLLEAEEGREMLGLLIVGLWMAALSIWRKRQM